MGFEPAQYNSFGHFIHSFFILPGVCKSRKSIIDHYYNPLTTPQPVVPDLLEHHWTPGTHGFFQPGRNFIIFMDGYRPVHPICPERRSPFPGTDGCTGTVFEILIRPHEPEFAQTMVLGFMTMTDFLRNAGRPVRPDCCYGNRMPFMVSTYYFFQVSPMTMTAPATAPQVLHVLPIPAPKPHEIFYAVSLPSPMSPEKLDTTAGERENPSLNRAAASSGFVMPEVLLCLRSIDQGNGW